MQRVREKWQKEKEKRSDASKRWGCKQYKRRSREDEDDREDETVVSSTVIKRRH